MDERLGVTPTIATSDDPAASDKISAFAQRQRALDRRGAHGLRGVDIPRLRVGVYATNTVTELFFRQAVGRLVRWTGRWARQTAYMFIPDDIRLRTFAAGIAEQRRHSLRKREEDGPAASARRPPARPRSAPPPEDDGQLSLFSAISAMPLDEQGRPLEATRLWTEEGVTTAGPDVIPGLIGDSARWPPTTSTTPPAAAAQPPRRPRRSPRPTPCWPAGQHRQRPGAPPPAARAEQRDRARAGPLDRHKTHAEMNAELNSKVGIKRISEATVRQLEQRLELARRLIRGRP